MFMLAGLTEEKLKALQQFEAESGLRVLAVTPISVEPAPIAADDLARLQDLERQLGVCLLAVK